MKDYKPIVKKKNSDGARRLGSTSSIDVKRPPGGSRIPAGGQVDIGWDPCNTEEYIVDEYAGKSFRYRK